MILPDIRQMPLKIRAIIPFFVELPNLFYPIGDHRNMNCRLADYGGSQLWLSESTWDVCGLPSPG